VEWRFVGPEGEVALRVSGRFRSNSGSMLYAAMLGGAGIGNPATTRRTTMKPRMNFYQAALPAPS
jgi:hypothetical protein